MNCEVEICCGKDCRKFETSNVKDALTEGNKIIEIYAEKGVC